MFCAPEEPHVDVFGGDVAVDYAGEEDLGFVREGMRWARYGGGEGMEGNGAKGREEKGRNGREGSG